MENKSFNEYDDTNKKNKDEIKKYIGKKVVEGLVKLAAKEMTKTHGSKVKKGLYEECEVTLVGTKACIRLENGEYLELTDKNVKKIKFIKKKHKIDHTYYYYEMEFHDGRSSYIRIRRKYKEAMYEHCTCI